MEALATGCGSGEPIASSSGDLENPRDAGWDISWRFGQHYDFPSLNWDDLTIEYIFFHIYICFYFPNKSHQLSS